MWDKQRMNPQGSSVSGSVSGVSGTGSGSAERAHSRRDFKLYWAANVCIPSSICLLTLLSTAAALRTRPHSLHTCWFCPTDRSRPTLLPGSLAPLLRLISPMLYAGTTLKPAHSFTCIFCIPFESASLLSVPLASCFSIWKFALLLPFSKFLNFN